MPGIRARVPSWIPDLVTAFEMVARPGRLFESGAALDPVVFDFRIAWERWFIVRGEEAHRQFFQLSSEDVDPFHFRVRMPTLRLPGVGPPLDMVRSTKLTRTSLAEHFRTKGLENRVDVFLDEARATLERTFCGEEGHVPDFFDFCLRTFIRGGSRVLLDDELFEQLPPEYVDWYVEIEEGLTISRLLVPWWPSISAWRGQGAAKSLVSTLRSIIERRRRTPPELAPRDLLQGYVEPSVVDGIEVALTDDEIIWTLNSVQWAAHHYPAVHAFWGMVDLLSHPDVLAAVMAEQARFDAVTGDTVGGMRLLRGCVFESLRRHPLVALPRLVTRDIVFCGVEVPRGSVLAVSPYLSHHDDESYPDPHRFEPDRWTGPDVRPSGLRFIPGGGGQWGCVGMQLTVAMLTGLWAALLRQFELEFVGERPVLDLTAMLMPPKEKTALRYRRRPAAQT